MGYYISSFYSISSNDKHRYFVYFVNGKDMNSKLNNHWINDWVHKKFKDISTYIGPEGVIVLPSARKFNDEMEVLDMYGLDVHGMCTFSDYAKNEDNALHSNYPLLLITKSPITKFFRKPVGLCINLIQSKDIDELSKIFDQIIKCIKDDDWDLLIDSFPEQERLPENISCGKDRWAKYLKDNSLFEFKPNLFGIGINLNKAIEIISNKILKKRGNKKVFNKLVGQDD